MDLTLTDWIAVLIVALPLIAKVLTDYASATDQAHSTALARIEGMAARLAANIARKLQEMPPGISGKELESKMIATASADIVGEMSASIARAGGDTGKVTAMVTAELNKLLVGAPKPPAPPVVPVVVAAEKVTT
jgi:hypothetical protein